MNFKNKTLMILSAIIFSTPALATTHMRFWFINRTAGDINVMYKREACMTDRGGPLTRPGGVQLSPGEESYADVTTVDGSRCDPSLVSFSISELMVFPPNGQMPTTIAAFDVGGGTAQLIKPDQANAWNFPSAEEMRYGYTGPAGVSPYAFEYQLFFNSLYAGPRPGTRYENLNVVISRPFYVP